MTCRTPESVTDRHDDDGPDLPASEGYYAGIPVDVMSRSKPRTRWVELSLGAYIAVMALIIVWGLVAGGCVSAGYKSGTIDHPDGRKETYRSASYLDAREGAKGAADFVGGLGDGLLGSNGLIGLLGGGGVAGALGLLWRNGAVAKARKQAHDQGWDERERAGTVQQPLSTNAHTGAD